MLDPHAAGIFLPEKLRLIVDIITKGQGLAKTDSKVRRIIYVMNTPKVTQILKKTLSITFNSFVRVL